VVAGVTRHAAYWADPLSVVDVEEDEAVPVRARDASVAEVGPESVRRVPAVADSVVPVVLVPVDDRAVSLWDRAESLCVVWLDVVPAVLEVVPRPLVSRVPALPTPVAEVEPVADVCVLPLIADVRRVRSELIAGQLASSSIPDQDCVPAPAAVVWLDVVLDVPL
jgi:hypothetical protein